MNVSPLDQLLADLDQALTEDRKGTRAAHLLERYAQGGSEDWRRFALFEGNYYARNLVRLSDLFELIVLCWGAGQRSPIHDHAGQRCWMGVLQGRVRESIYQVGAGPLPTLTAGSVREFDAGSVAFVVDEIGWHRIEPVGDGAAVTLHLYSRPIRECRIFDDEQGVVRTRRLVYHSIGGAVTSPGAAGAR